MRVLYTTIDRYIDHKDLCRGAEVVLSEEEMDRFRGFRLLSDRINLIVSRRLMQRYLNEATGDELFSVRKNRFGKPFFENRNIHFSITHTRGVVAVAFSSEYEPGIDVEKVRELDIDEILGTIATDNERQRIIDSEKPFHEFFRLFTSKEAFLKAIGKGFSSDPRSINIDDMESRGEISVLRRELDDGFFLSLVVMGRVDLSNTVVEMVPINTLC